ncbi:MAG: serine/threonine protein kinase [Planctomycetes bacterium]|nr:serine/threonine protein kinase [Planctomycetota bacterium]
MESDSKPAGKSPGTRGDADRGRARAVPELNPEGEPGHDTYFGGHGDETERPEERPEEDDSFVSPEVEQGDDVFDAPTDSDTAFEPVEDSLTEADDDTDRAGSGRQEATKRDTHGFGDDATELQPESSTDLTADTQTGNSNASLYPGKLPEVRAPGWEQSGMIERGDLGRREVERPGKPESAPELEPASAPSLAAFSEDAIRHSEDAPPMTPIDEPAVQKGTRRHYTAVDQAAKELARAALQAEIEKEEKQALRGYEPEEGEIPPSPEVAKRFDVILQLGKGGMAVVYLCRDPRRSGKVFAVKDIRAEMKPGMKVEQRVEHEAMLLKELDHPGIVKVFDFLKFQRGSAIVMEYIDGLPLDHEIGAGRRIHWDFGARILQEIGRALEYAHRYGVIHRDIKPDNILWSERHNVMKLVDFGLARMYGDPTEIHMTRTGMVVGTPHYMSPEQVSGKVLDGRSDIYSFGATLYYLLTGQRHVEGTNVMDILEQQRSKDILPPSHTRHDIPAWLSYIVGKMMEIKPDDRYQSMTEVLEDLELARANPDTFVQDNPRGRVKRYGGKELAPFAAESDAYATEPSGGWPSSQSPAAGDRTTNKVSARHRKTTRHHTPSSSQVSAALPEVTALDENVTSAQMSAMLRQISTRLEESEKRQVGPGVLVLIVLLSVLIVMLLIAGGLLLAMRDPRVRAMFGF